MITTEWLPFHVPRCQQLLEPTFQCTRMIIALRTYLSMHQNGNKEWVPTIWCTKIPTATSAYLSMYQDGNNSECVPFGVQIFNQLQVPTFPCTRMITVSDYHSIYQNANSYKSLPLCPRMITTASAYHLVYKDSNSYKCLPFYVPGWQQLRVPTILCTRVITTKCLPFNGPRCQQLLVPTRMVLALRTYFCMYQDYNNWVPTIWCTTIPTAKSPYFSMSQDNNWVHAIYFTNIPKVTSAYLYIPWW